MDNQIKWNDRMALACALGYGLSVMPALIHFPGVAKIAGWSPQAAVSLVLVLLGGRRWWPVVVVASVGAALLAPETETALLAAFAIGLAQAAAMIFTAWLLRRPLRIDPDLATFADVARFLVAVAVGALLIAAPLAGWGWARGGLAFDDGLDQLGRAWLGDSIELLVLVPLLLVWRAPPWRRGRPSWESLAQAAAIAAAAAVLFPAAHGSRFYPMFIPIVWVGARFGVAGMVLALTEMYLAVTVGMAAADVGAAHILKLQILMLSLAATGLLLGAVVSERERVRASVAHGKARLKAIVDLAPDGMLIADDAGRVDTANRHFERLYGADAVGRPLSELLSLSAEGGATSLRRRDGSALAVEASFASFDIAGRNASVVTVRDISARRRAEARLGLRRAALEHASRSTLTMELAAVVAHELNQPLAAVAGYAAACQRTLAAAEATPPRALEQLAKAIAQAERAGKVLRQIRGFFSEAGIETEAVAVAEMIDEVLLLLADQAAALGVRFDVAVAPGLMVEAGRLQIEQVMINLIRNSLDALAEAGERERVVRISAQAGGDGTIEIAVADTGPGIAEDVAPALFSPFVSTRAAGMGLGLTISRSIIGAHGGRLWAEAGPAQGAVLRFTLPGAGAS